MFMFSKEIVPFFSHLDKAVPSNAGINLTGYHPPGHPGAFAPKCVPSPRAFAQQKMPGSINDDVPGAGHLHQLAFKHENFKHSHLGLKIKLSMCPIVPVKARRLGILYQTAYLLSAHKLAL